MFREIWWHNWTGVDRGTYPLSTIPGLSFSTGQGEISCVELFYIGQGDVPSVQFSVCLFTPGSEKSPAWDIFVL